MRFLGFYQKIRILIIIIKDLVLTLNLSNIYLFECMLMFFSKVVSKRVIDIHIPRHSLTLILELFAIPM